jgi:hypothetical protein
MYQIHEIGILVSDKAAQLITARLRAQKEIRETILFTTASKTIK